METIALAVLAVATIVVCFVLWRRGSEDESTDDWIDRQW